MDQFLPRRLDGFFRAHPRIMLACIIVLAVVVSLLLISQTTRDVVVYEAF
jgi:hypothetical protein